LLNLLFLKYQKRVYQNKVNYCINRNFVTILEHDQCRFSVFLNSMFCYLYVNEIILFLQYEKTNIFSNVPCNLSDF